MSDTPPPSDVPPIDPESDQSSAAADTSIETAAVTATKKKRFGHWSKRRRRLTFGGISLVCVIILLAGGLYGYGVYRNDQIKHITVKNLTKIPTTGVENILMIGSTSRCALKVQNAAFGLCSQGVNGVNSDVILLMHLDPKNHRVALLSFPRDTFLPNARPNENNRIDSALVYGPGQLVKAVEQDFGLPINHFVVLNFDSFQGVVNALGGLNMYFPNPVKDAYSQLNVQLTGCVHLNGFQALAVVRARHMEYKVNGKWLYDGTGDLGRIVRDHEFLRVLADSLAKKSLGNPVTDNSIFGAIAPQLEVDKGFSLHEIVNLVLTYHGIDANKAPEYTLPVLVDPSFSYMYKGYNYGSIVFPSEPQDLATIASFAKQKLAGKKLLPSSVSVAVEGGIGSTSGTASTVTSLKALGFNVTGSSEIPSVGPISETQVLYQPGHLAQGERVLEEFRGAVALGQSTTKSTSAVTVVTGSDFSIAPPVATSTGTSTTTPTKSSTKKTATTAATTAITNAELMALIEGSTLISSVTTGLTAPTPARTPLPSYDPRACTAKQAKNVKNLK